MEGTSSMNYHNISPRTFLVQPDDPFNVKITRVDRNHSSKLKEMLFIIKENNLLNKEHCEGCKYLITSETANFGTLKNNSMMHNISVMSEEILKETSNITLQ